MKTYRWTEIREENAPYHLARAHMTGKAPCAIHGQHFPEVFWVEQGQGLHVINGQMKKLFPGDLIWIRASDRHGFRTVTAEGFVLTNLAFPMETAAHLQDRYFPDQSCFLWHSKILPERFKLDAHQLKRLKEWTTYLDRAPKTQFEIDRFLIDLMHRLTVERREDLPRELPDWLAGALDQFKNPIHFSEGVHGLAALAGRTPEHVNASLRDLTGKTATETVNQIRMTYAAGELRISTKKILEICFDCGFENLSHFYTLFKKHFGVTPRTYRLRHLTTVGG